MTLDWWPAAEGGAWAWQWRAYPGVWSLVLGLAASYVLLARRARAGPRSARGGATRREAALFGAGLLVLLVACDWPLGPLAAGYLLTGHVLQYMLIALAAAPLLLLGLPRAARPRRREPPGLLVRVLGVVTHPLIAAAVFAIVLFATHLPSVVDALRPHEAGSFAINLGWLASALLFWWPVVGPFHARAPMPYMRGLLYLFLPFVLPKVPGVAYIFSTDPAYALYERAPRATALSAHGDELLAGILVWLVGSAFVLAALAVLFFRWYAEDQRMSRPDTLALPADPRAVELLFAVPGGWAALERLAAIVEAAAAPPETGAELSFAIDDAARWGGGRGECVVLELHLPRAASEARIHARVHAEYDAYLRGLDPRVREAIAARLAFRVVGYGSRVG